MTNSPLRLISRQEKIKTVAKSQIQFNNFSQMPAKNSVKQFQGARKFRRTQELIRKSAELFRKSAELFRKSPELFRKSAELIREKGIFWRCQDEFKGIGIFLKDSGSAQTHLKKFTSQLFVQKMANSYTANFYSTHT